MVQNRVLVEVFGRVQGVCFRYYAVERAKSLDLTGYVRNCLDGSVEVIAEGDEDRLRSFVDWTREGSPASRVREIKVTWDEFRDEFDNFTVKF
ncbi:acylphosphatase [Candidatus Dependentiae bacterium]|nr:acylphosphatase [Candidatus Dependentiae bacterium]